MSAYKTIGIIPARYASSRFPGKILADLCGKPVLWYAYTAAKGCDLLDDVYVAADSEKICEACNLLGINAIMTSDKHPCATDRLAEVSDKIESDTYVNVFGDEPLIAPNDISITINALHAKPDAWAAYLCEKYRYPLDVVNPTTVKYALNDESEIIYASRSAIPFPHSRLDYDLFKHVGVYAYTKQALDFYRKTPIGRIESIESIEQLRLLENRKLVKAAITDNFSMSVDTPKDLERVRRIVEERQPLRHGATNRKKL